MKDSMKGGKLPASVLKQMLQNTYKENPQQNIGGFTLDTQLSSDTTLIYVNSNTREIKVAIRGTKSSDPTDWIPNILYGMKSGLEQITPRFRNTKKIVEKVRHKYPDYTIEWLTHSQSAIHGRSLAKPNESIVSVNPVYKGNEFYKNEQVIRSSGDPVSMLGVFPSWYRNLIKEQKDITTSYIANPLKAHSLDVLDELGDQMVGAGVCPDCGYRR